MTTRPTLEQVRAYAEALIAWSEGKKVQCLPPCSLWRPFYGEHLEAGWEYRIVPDPPKARECIKEIFAS
jgi:hypothetical protein